jgi:hypothetical protein
MAKKKKSGPNMSQEIRDLLAQNPDMAVSEVISNLATKGLKIKPNLVYFIKGKLNAKKQRKTRVVRAAKEASTAGSNGTVVVDPLTLIREIKGIAVKAGGIKKLKALVEALAE